MRPLLKLCGLVGRFETSTQRKTYPLLSAHIQYLRNTHSLRPMLMEQWKGKVALVTGASAGIGVAIVEDLVKSGLTVVGTARRVELVQEVAERLQGEPGRLIPRQLDVGNEKDVIATFQWLDCELGGADILINNAGYMGTTPIPDMTTEEIRKSFDTNVFGLTLICREGIRSMQRRDMKNGHIINLNSILGHTIPRMPGVSFGVYPATKFAVTATCEVLRGDIAAMGSTIRVTSLSPGIVKTGLSDAVQAKFEGIPILLPEDIARSVHFVLSMPPHVEISELTILPVAVPS